MDVAEMRRWQVRGASQQVAQVRTIGTPRHRAFLQAPSLWLPVRSWRLGAYPRIPAPGRPCDRRNEPGMAVSSLSL
jgi:hypothetical protein